MVSASFRPANTNQDFIRPMRLRYLAGYGSPLLSMWHKIQSSIANKASGAVRILTYHDIPDSGLELFKKQISYLASKYRFLTPSQFDLFIRGERTIAGINILLTFDDGYRSHRVVAEKILDEYGIKAVFFITTGFVGIKNEAERKKFILQKLYNGVGIDDGILTEMKPLTWQDLGYLIQQGHTIGAHTKTHRRFTDIHSQDDLYDEIIEGGNVLAKNLGGAIDYFSYPFGDINSINLRAMEVIKTRYKCCFSGLRGLNHSSVLSYGILRDSADINDPLAYLRLIIEGGLDIVYRRKVEKLLEIVNRQDV